MMLFPEEGQGQPVLIPYAPREIEYSGIAGEFATMNRPGLSDALVYARPGLKTLNFTILLVDKVLRSGSWLGAITINALETLQQLSQYAATGTKLRMAYSSSEAGSWRITEFSPSSVLRDENDEITHAIVQMQLTQASDPSVGVGPVTGGAGAGASPAPPPPAAAPAAIAYYTVVAGDTLWGIAIRYYGDGNLWPGIADTNGITDPRSLQIGTTLRIP
jgi:LysM repeat protein